MFAFQTRMTIRRENGVWFLETGVFESDPIPHETWEQAWSHAAFIRHIWNGEA